MRMYDLIEEKKRGDALSEDEIAYMNPGIYCWGYSGLSDGSDADGHLFQRNE